MNRIFKSLILLPLLVLTSCNETTTSIPDKLFWKYEDFLTEVRRIGYKKVLNDGVYQYNESTISDRSNSSLLVHADLSFYDAFKGTSSAFSSSYCLNNAMKEEFKKWRYDGVYFNYYDILVDPIYSVTGKYGKEVDFNFDFNLRPFYQLFFDEEFAGLTFLYFSVASYNNCFTVFFKEEYLNGKNRIEENTSLLFNHEDLSFFGIYQSIDKYDENGQKFITETKSLVTSRYNELTIDQVIKAEEYIDLSATCLPNMRF